MEQRIIDLEEKVAYQELTIEQLNQVITEQQSEILEIKSYLKILQSKIDNLQALEKELKEPPPPHY